jgi:hypothetical protein
MLDRSTGHNTLVLRDARMYARGGAPEGVSCVQLFFDRLARGIRVLAVDGALECSQVVSGGREAEEEDRVRSGFWAPLLGAVLESSWHMTNEQGRSDALELRLRSRGDGTRHIVRMEASGSEILISEMESVRCVGDPTDHDAAGFRVVPIGEGRRPTARA